MRSVWPMKAIAALFILICFYTPAAYAGASSHPLIEIAPDDPLIEEMQDPSVEWKAYRPPVDSRDGALWLRLHLKSPTEDSHLFMYPLPRSYTVYQGGEIVYKSQSETDASADPRVSRLLTWAILPLSTEAIHDEVFIKLEGRAPFLLFSGTEAGLFGTMLKLDAANLVLIIAMTVISAFALLLHFIYREGRLLLYYSLFLFHHFVVLFTGTQLLSKQLLFELPPLVYFYWFLLGNFVDFTLLLLLFRQLLPVRSGQWVLKLTFVYSGIGVLSVAAVTLHALAYPVIMAVAGMISLIGVRLFVLALSTAVLWQRRHTELLTFSVGFATFVALDLLLSIAMQFVEVSWVYALRMIQPLAFVIPGGMIVWRRYREAERKAEDYTSALQRMTRQLQEDNLRLEESISERTTELEEVHHRLMDHVQEQSAADLEMAALTERNRIAQEIHDIVGHTLTTTIVQIEAGKLLIDTSPERTRERLEVAQSLVRQGLEQIRGSVRLLRESEWSYDLTGAMETFIRETEELTGVVIRRSVTPLPELSMEQKNIVYLALREGITNGLKHGDSRLFELELHYDEPLLLFRLKNNGQPLGASKLGFGLHAMKQRVEHAGGWLKLTEAPDWNVVIEIRLPV